MRRIVLEGTRRSSVVRRRNISEEKTEPAKIGIAASMGRKEKEEACVDSGSGNDDLWLDGLRAMVVGIYEAL